MEEAPVAVRGVTGGSLSDSNPSIWSSNTAVLIYMALATVVLHAVVGNRYGWHADELATVEDARHLAWGYPATPPVTPFFGRVALSLFGTSLVGFRFFASLAHALTVVLAGLMARQLGGGRAAQILAGASALPFCIGGGALMQYVSFDYAAWVLTAYFILCVLESEDPRWWVAVGASVGFGMLSKYSMAFFGVGIGAGLLGTEARRYLKSKWLWAGVGVAFLMFLPHLVWQVQHHFVSLALLRHIHARDVQNGKTAGFLSAQIGHSFLFLVLPGLYFYLISPRGKRFRMLGWMYVATLLLFLVAKGKSYYMFPAYPMIYAAGAVWGEGWLAAMRRRTVAITLWGLAWAVLAHAVVFTIVYYLPLAPVNPGARWWEKSSAMQETYRDELGWPEEVKEVARIRDSLTPEERARLGILGTTYGEAGAVNLFGPQYGLPRAISGVNSFRQRGYGDPAPQTLIVLGQTRRVADELFEGCKLAGHTFNRYGVRTGETTWNPDIFVCGPPKQGWPEFWEHFQYFD